MDGVVEDEPPDPAVTGHSAGSLPSPGLPQDDGASSRKFQVLENDWINGVINYLVRNLSTGRSYWVEARNPSVELKQAIADFEQQQQRNLSEPPSHAPTPAPLPPDSTEPSRRSKRVQQMELIDLRFPIEGESDDEDLRGKKKKRKSNQGKDHSPRKSKNRRTSSAPPIPANQYSRGRTPCTFISAFIFLF
jgi:hypothetical protein